MKGNEELHMQPKCFVNLGKVKTIGNIKHNGQNIQTSI